MLASQSARKISTEAESVIASPTDLPKKNKSLRQLLPPYTKDKLLEVEERILSQSLNFPKEYREHVTCALANSGKLLRSALLLLSAEISSPRQISHKHIELAGVIELIHLATLVHDDIVDNAKTRRKEQTLNAKLGNSLALLIGDSIFAHALSEACLLPGKAYVEKISQAARDLCSGEILQNLCAFDLEVTDEKYLQIVEKKTAELFSISAELGAKLSGADKNMQNAFALYGKNVGVAYQIYDDCLDIKGKSESSGKNLRSDWLSGKLTLPVIFYCQNSSAHKVKMRSLFNGNLENLQALEKDEDWQHAIEESLNRADDILHKGVGILRDHLPSSPELERLLKISQDLRQNIYHS